MWRAWIITEGQVALSVEDGAPVTQPVQKRYTLASLLAQCDLSQPLNAEEREWIEAASAGLEEI
jgi:antitoxin ChpS